MYLLKYLMCSYWVHLPHSQGLVFCLGNSHAYSDAESNTSSVDSKNAFQEVSGEVVSTSVIGSNNKTTDFGTVGRAFDFANNALDSSQMALKEVTNNSQVFADGLKDFAESQSTNNDQRMITAAKWLAGVVVVIGGIKAYKGGK